MNAPDPPNEQPDTDWLTVAEYAAAMRRSTRTVWRWIDKGLLPHRRFGRTTRIHRSALEPPAAGADTPGDGAPSWGRPSEPVRAVRIYGGRILTNVHAIRR